MEVEPDREALRLVEQHRVNLLLVGDDEIVQRLVESLSTRFHQPVGTWSPGEQLVLPPAERTGTMVLRDVGSLDLQDQIQLLEWLGTACGRTQVVSTTPLPTNSGQASNSIATTIMFTAVGIAAWIVPT